MGLVEHASAEIVGAGPSVDIRGRPIRRNAELQKHLVSTATEQHTGTYCGEAHRALG